jgi:chitobiase/beta-hexosaminidase-like protein
VRGQSLKRGISLFPLTVAAIFLSGCPTAPPQITPAAGTYNCPQSVTITDANGFAAIYYSTDGTAPTTASTKYAGPFSLTSNATVSSMAVAPGADPSNPVSAAFTCAPLSRGDFAVLVQQAFNLPQPSSPIVFPDVHSTDADYAAVEAVAPYMNAQIVCPGCQLSVDFSPNQPVLRVISTLALVRILTATGRFQLLSAPDSQAVLSNVSDAGTLPIAARPYFATAIKNGVLSLKAGNAIQADQPHSRSEMTALLSTVQGRFNIAVTPAQ